MPVGVVAQERVAADTQGRRPEHVSAWVHIDEQGGHHRLIPARPRLARTSARRWRRRSPTSCGCRSIASPRTMLIIWLRTSRRQVVREHNPNFISVSKGSDETHPVRPIRLRGRARASTAGQDKPSFSGTWKLVDPASPDQFTPTVVNVFRRHRADRDDHGPDWGVETSDKLDGREAPSPMDFNGMTIDRMTRLIWKAQAAADTTSRWKGNRSSSSPSGR